MGFRGQIWFSGGRYEFHGADMDFRGKIWGYGKIHVRVLGRQICVSRGRHEFYGHIWIYGGRYGFQCSRYGF